MILSIRQRPAAFAVAAFFVALFALLSPQASHAQDKPALLVNISSKDPWRVASAVFFAAQFGVKEGHPTTLFVTIDAVPLFTKAKASVRSKEFGVTLHRMVRDYQSLGGKVVVCSVCLQQLRIDEQQLIDGVDVANVQATNAILFRPDTKVISW